MLSNYLKTALRTLWKHKSHTLINVLGLSLGISACLVIFSVLRYELSFDAFHPQADRIFRVFTVFEREERSYQVGTPRPFLTAFQQDFDQEAEVLPIEIYQYWNQVKTRDKTIVLESKPGEGPKIAFTQNQYFQFFNFPLLQGDPNQVLRQPNEVVIAQPLAERLFGQASEALGAIINVDDSLELKVTGIMEPVPKNTDFPFEMLISYNTLPRDQSPEEGWGSNSTDYQVFVRLRHQVDAAQVEERLPAFLTKYAGEDYLEDKQPALQPLSDLHFNKDLPTFKYRTMPREVLWGMGWVALLIIVTACINFVNLATALSTQRAKEVGVRKALGSSRFQLMSQFLSEALIITLVAVGVSLGFAELAIIQLGNFAEYRDAIHLSFSPPTLVFLLLLILGITLVAGGYPAWVLTRFSPVQVVKGTLSRRVGHRVTLRQALVVFQFGITQALIIGTLAVAYQLNFLKDAPLGFDEEAILFVQFPAHTTQDLDYMRNQIASHSGVQAFSLSMDPAMSGNFWFSNFFVQGDSSDVDRHTQRQFADEHYFATYGMELLAGEGLHPSDTTNRYVVNETFMRSLGYTSAEEIIGTHISFHGRQHPFPITGVVADYNMTALTEKINPLVISSESGNYRTMNLKINMAQAQDVLQHVEKVWKDIYPESPFDYEFLDESMEQFYESYARTFTLIQVFSGVAILIGSLGLYGLVTFMAEQKTKEIGVRKVLGASVLNIVNMFSWEFAKLIFIAFAIAAPLAFYVMRGWLENFEYRIQLGAPIFLGGILATLLIALLTVSYRSVRAALANPIDSLRNE